jgi:signal transduction histidine kinase
MTFSYLPIFCVDVFGSVLMIVLGVLCLRLALKIRAHDGENVLWIYLVWVCYGLVIFAVSRSAGHIVKQCLLLYGHDAIWDRIRPFSGAVNTLAFVLVASITLFFRQLWKIYQQIQRDRRALVRAHDELKGLNRDLEDRVDARTRALAEAAEQRMTLEKHMAQTEKLAAIGELSAGVAHEINNPLGIILGYSQLLIRGEADDSHRLGDLKTIEKHVKHCQRIVTDLLSFSRNTAREKSPCDIHDILDEVMDFIGRHSDFSRITVIRDYDTALPPLMLDREKIKQVFINLVMNARHAMESQGTIRLQTRYLADKHRVDLRITDDGIGIPEADITRIFEPFFTTKPTGQGTGLGLSVTYGIIRDHGGDISVTSRAGEGSTFTIELPVMLTHERPI